MTALLDGLGGTLLDATLAAAVLSSLCALLMVACQQPARRCLVARLAVLGLLALIPLAVFGSRPRWELAATLRAFAPPTGTLPAWLEAGGRGSRTIGRGLSGLYLGGVAVGLGWVGLGLWASRRLVRGSREASEELRRRYHLLGTDGRRSPALRVSERLRGPVLVGMFRPTIVIPSGMEEPEWDEALRLGLLHELVHAERRDPGFALLGSLAGACWFFLPMLWWIRAQMRLDQEFLADRAASEQYGPFGTYAASLVTLADSRTSASPSERNGSSEVLRKTPLMLRVLMLVRCPFGVEMAPPLWWRGMLSGLVGLATLLVSGLSLRSRRAARAAGQSARPIARHVPAGPPGHRADPTGAGRSAAALYGDVSARRPVRTESRCLGVAGGTAADPRRRLSARAGRAARGDAFAGRGVSSGPDRPRRTGGARLGR